MSMWDKKIRPKNDILQGDNLKSVKSLLKKSSNLSDGDLWKLFGYESKAGRSLYLMFNRRMAPGILYPKPLTKVWSPVKEHPKKPCPQMTKIEYPEVRMSLPKLPKPVDAIPKRKNEAAIKKEIEYYYDHIPLQGNVGVNRNTLIKSTQNKFEKSRGALPKNAELPTISQEKLLESDFDPEYKDRAYAKIPQKSIPFVEKRKNKKPVDEAEDLIQTKEEKMSGEDRELNKLYRMVEDEILERQEYLEEIAHLSEPALKSKIKMEIVERVHELEKIIKLLNSK